jgi:uncharacterized membrane protein
MEASLFRLIPPADLAALVLFCILWLGYAPIVRLFGPGAINAGLGPVRERWMASMVARDNRIVDSQLIGHVMHSATFFASTSILAVGALLGVLTGLDRLQPALEDLSLTSAISRGLLEVKLLLPVAVLTHGMFNLTWALRQMNYTLALLGAVPPPPVADAEALARPIAAVLSNALTTFNTGIRNYYFALAALTWLGGAVPLTVTALVLMAVLVHRQHFSRVSREFNAARHALDRAHRNAG